MGKHALAVARGAGVLVLCLATTLSTAAESLANTLLVMGGTFNGTGLNPAIQQELGGDPWYPHPQPDPFRTTGAFGHGYLDTLNNPASPFFGWNSITVGWPAAIVGFEASQRQGLNHISAAVDTALASDGSVTAFGYSSSANVMVREMRALQSLPAGAPATDRLQFLLVGNPNRPNGGILQRFTGLDVPLVDVHFDGSTPLDTPYATTDVSWEYDAASDFPTYPLNLLAVANAVLTGAIVHGDYFYADIHGARAFPDSTVGNITYVTLKTPHLPLLMPLYDIGFPKPLLDLVEPALTVMVDWGYDRSIGPGVPTTAGLLPRIDPATAVTQLANAINQGVRDFVADLTPDPVRARVNSPEPGNRSPRTESAGRSRSGAAAAGAAARSTRQAR